MRISTDLQLYNRAVATIWAGCAIRKAIKMIVIACNKPYYVVKQE